MSGYATAFANGFMSPNDIRRLENLDPIPDEEGGNVYVANGSYVKLKDIGAAYAQKTTEQPEQEKPQEQQEPQEPQEPEAPEETESKSHKERHAARKKLRKGGE